MISLAVLILVILKLCGVVFIGWGWLAFFGIMALIFE
jgi:hypothetical protein